MRVQRCIDLWFEWSATPNLVVYFPLTIMTIKDIMGCYGLWCLGAIRPNADVPGPRIDVNNQRVENLES